MLVQDQTVIQTQQLNLRQLNSLALLAASSADLVEQLETVAWNHPLLTVRRPQPAQSGTYEEWMQPAQTLRETLEQYLTRQLNELSLSKVQVAVVQALIARLDQHGYLAASSDALAASLGVDASCVARAVKILQSLDPPGIGARSAQENLLIQIKRNPQAPKEAAPLITEHADELANHHYRRILAQMQMTPERFEQVMMFLRQLSPRPDSRFFTATATQYVVPEVAVDFVAGEPQVTLIKQNQPVLIFDCSDLHGQGELTGNAEVKKYLTTELAEYKALNRALRERGSTVLTIAQIIVTKQVAFIRDGAALAPLTIVEIANQLALNSSTVSRAISGKYLRVNQQVIALRSLLSHDIGNHQSQAGALQLMATIVAQEDVRQPLTDDAISQQLAAQGFHISRRTVAKYRHQLGILGSTKRRLS
ncbi:RNA polymerase factor sigma-54 [Lacticaseibacillus daqingensis]|uniref:RNA polymerase factor sigma-54 n=1 Tax=Lacticaseibacillus daqingensis TaxID=2486014 RepID=UPI000F7A9AEF|nr:RNA polymerase factor sigma-54 [Lacticaseibacillus daqingensis]